MKVTISNYVKKIEEVELPEYFYTYTQWGTRVYCRCSFGECCDFREYCSFEGIGEYVGVYPFVAFIGCGSYPGSKTYVYNLAQDIYVRCGCFLGTLAEFRDRVIEENTDALYLDLADLAERRLNEWR